MQREASDPSTTKFAARSATSLPLAAHHTTRTLNPAPTNRFTHLILSKNKHKIETTVPKKVSHTKTSKPIDQKRRKAGTTVDRPEKGTELSWAETCPDKAEDRLSITIDIYFKLSHPLSHTATDC